MPKRPARPTPVNAPPPAHIVREVSLKARVSFLDANGYVTKADWTKEIAIHEAAFTPDMIKLLRGLGLTVAEPRTTTPAPAPKEVAS